MAKAISNNYVSNNSKKMSSSVATAAEAEVWIVPFFGQGHLFPCIELCKQIASRNYKSTLIIPSHISPTSITPSSLHQHHHLLPTTMLSCTAKCFKAFETSFQPGNPKRDPFVQSSTLWWAGRLMFARILKFPLLGSSLLVLAQQPWCVPCSRLASKMSNRERPVYFLGYPRIRLYSDRIWNTGLTGPFLVVHHLCEVRPVQRKWVHRTPWSTTLDEGSGGTDGVDVQHVWWSWGTIY